MTQISLERRHFQFIAEVIRNTGPPVCCAVSAKTREAFARQFALHLKATNPTFQEDTFLKACGVLDPGPTSLDPREPNPSRHGLFRDHNCFRCDSGARKCEHPNGPNLCKYPHARND